MGIPLVSVLNNLLPSFSFYLPLVGATLMNHMRIWLGYLKVDSNLCYYLQGMILFFTYCLHRGFHMEFYSTHIKEHVGKLPTTKYIYSRCTLRNWVKDDG